LQEFTPSNSCNSLQLMLRLVLAGHAIAVLPLPIVRDQLATGELRILPARPHIPPAPYYASYLNEAHGPGTSVIVEIARSVLEKARFFARSADAPGPGGELAGWEPVGEPDPAATLQE